MSLRMLILVVTLCTFCQGCALPQAETYHGKKFENRETGGVI